MRLRRAALLAGLPVLALGACVAPPTAQAPAAPPAAASGPAPARGPRRTDPQLTNALVDLFERKDRHRVDLSKSEGTPLGEILKVGSPVGYQLRNRFLNIGVPLAEALSRNDDPVFREKLVTLARWDKDGETRAAALVALARAGLPKDAAVFSEALVHLDPAVRFGAIGALQTWGQNALAAPLLDAAATKDYEPILRVYASAGLARIGDPRGLQRLRAFLDDASWLVRAMAGRYLGDYGTGDDYDLVVSRIGREQTNDFVVAELCIAALKLFPRRPA